MTEDRLTKFARRPCPICAARRVAVLHAQRFHLPVGSPLPEAYDVVACPQCGLVYADTPAPQSAYDRYYAEYSKYEDPAVATGGGSSALDSARLEETAEIIASRVDPRSRILDIGCAGGGLLLALRRRGFADLCGSDGAQACVEQVERMGIPAIRTSVLELGRLAEDRPYDLIILSHVLEHVVALGDLMDAVVRLVARGGSVYAETPDASGYNDHRFVPFYFFDSEHINHFDIERLGLLGSSHGLRPEEGAGRVLRVADDKTYPACWVWLRKRDRFGRQAALGGSRTLRDRVAQYVERSRAAERFPALRDLAASRKPVIVWGAGSFAGRLFGEDALAGCRIVAMVDRDRNKQGLSFAGHTIEAPEDAIRRHPSAVILVAAAVQDEAILSEARRVSPGCELVKLTPGVDPGTETRG